MKAVFCLLCCVVVVAVVQSALPALPLKPACPPGRRISSCGGFVGAQCPPGSTCIYRPFSTLGDCCRDNFIPCKHGSSGQCGGKMDLPCPKGSTCQLPFGVVDGFGHCCRDAPVLSVCPPASPNPGICVFDPKRNCLGDEFCPPGSLCCPEGCGRVCKPEPMIVPTSPDS